MCESDNRGQESVSLRAVLPHGLFVSFEGPEGAGKSTQIALLSTVLRDRGYAVTVTREPGGTPLGEQLRDLIKHFGGPEAVSPRAELLLFGASRAQHMDEIIEPHLARGGVVLCDRFADSTTVYQGCARRLDPEFIRAMHRFTLADRWPDLTILLDIPAEQGLVRARNRAGNGTRPDRIEAESPEFHEAVRQGFLDLAAREPGRFRVISAERPVAVVHADILEVVNGALA